MSKATFWETQLEGMVLVESKEFEDARGYLAEITNQEIMERLGIDKFWQQNLSHSHPRVLRGMHCSRKYPQGKLVRCLSGVIHDIAVDCRKDSKTFGKYAGFTLNEPTKALWIPPGFAHGFYTLTNSTVLYSCSGFPYMPEFDGGFRYDDPEVGINLWPTRYPIVSEKDHNLPTFSDFVASVAW